MGKTRRFRKFTDEECIKALKKTGGRVYKAAEILGCKGPSVLQRVRASLRVRTAFEDIRGKMLDTAEDELIRKVEEGDVNAIKFYLTQMGKDRGYGETPQVTNNTIYQTHITNNQIKVDFNSLSREEMKVLSKMAGIPFHDSKEVLEQVEKEVKCLPQ